MTPNYIFNAEILTVVDGDTLDILIDTGFGVRYKTKIRLYGIDTPEIHGPKSKTQKQAGLLASTFVSDWVDSVNAKVVIKSHDGKALKQEKYGRWLAEVFALDSDVSLNEILVEKGFAKKVTY